MRRTLVGIFLFAGFLALYVLAPPTTLLDPGEYERATVTITDENGSELATVDVRVAETRAQRQVGLSRTDALENGTGMLFVHDDAGQHRYVMRNMSFGLDIVFVDSDGTITEIHDAPAPPAGEGSYRGTGKYVLEVPRGWCDARGIGVGDTVEIPADISSGE